MSTKSRTSPLRSRSSQSTMKKTAKQLTVQSKRKPNLSSSVRSKRHPRKAKGSKIGNEISRRKNGSQRSPKKSIPKSPPRKLRSSLKLLGKRTRRISSNYGARRGASQVSNVLNYLSEALDHEWNGYLKHLQIYRQKTSAKTVYELRFSTRRLMTCLELIERLSPDNTVRRARIILKEQLSRLTELRDAHIETIAIRSYLKQLPEIKQFYDELHDKENGNLDAVKKTPSNSKFIENAVNRAKIRLMARRATMTVSAAKNIITNLVDRSFDNVNRNLEHVTLADYSTIHSVGLAFKPFRYLLDMVQPVTQIEHKQVRIAQSLARMMGQIQSIEALMKELVESKWKKDSTREAMIEIWLDLERRKADAAQRFLRALPKFGNIWKPITHESASSKTVDSKMLYVLRHGIAVARGDPNYPLESDRPLTLKGVKRTRQIAQGMRRIRVEFDVILTSAYTRALETAFIVGREYNRGESIQTTAALTPQVLPEELIRVLQDKYSSCRNLLLVGHEPQLSALISVLTSGSAGARPLMKKGGLCKLQVEKLQLGKCSTLMWLLTPKQLTNIT